MSDLGEPTAAGPPEAPRPPQQPTAAPPAASSAPISAASADQLTMSAIAALEAALATLAEVDLRDLSGDVLYRLVDQTEVAARRLAGLRSRALVVVEADGRWATDGSRSLAAWLRRRTQGSPALTHAHTRLARALRDHLPRTEEALAAGTIGAEHASALARLTTSTPARLEGLAHQEVGEAFLVEQAASLDAAEFTRLVRRWVIAADPQAADREWKDDADAEHLVLAKTLNGYHVQGWLTEASGATLDAALRARSGVPGADDTRTTSQRRASALVSLARLALDSGTLAPGAAIRPHLSVHVSYDTLLRLAAAQQPYQGDPFPSADPVEGSDPALGAGGVVIPGLLDPAPLLAAAPAELEDGTPLPHGLLARLACDSELARVVFGPDSEVLDVGRTRRLFTPAQRRAVIARDRHCQFPGCDAPPREGEIHHSVWWYAQQGHTRADAGVLLCWYHHDHVHSHNISIERTPSAGSDPRAPRWMFRRSNGRPITGPAAPRAGRTGRSAA